MTPQTANPGGILAPDEVVGRDALVARLWKILERRSIYLTAERRMGKTSIVRDKMGNETPKNIRLVYMDASKAATPLEFVEKLLHESNDILALGNKAKFFFASAGKLLAGSEVKAGVSFKLPTDLGANWKTLLESLLRDLAAHDQRIILAFDELPLMLDKIKQSTENSKGEVIIMELLDTLRAARQTNPELRMIYTGSLGLHHVLTSLKNQGYQNDPTNDMSLIEVEPLKLEDAAILASRLFKGEEILTNDLATSANHLAIVTDGMPYYIQHVVEELGAHGLNGEPNDIDQLIVRRFTDMRDPWHLRYYDERIDTHYREELRPLARALLDLIAESEVPLTFDDLTEGINPNLEATDPETVRNVLRLLGLDNYLSRNEDGGYLFRYPFLTRVWRALRK
jgi:hypothetical protein